MDMCWSCAKIWEVFNFEPNLRNKHPKKNAKIKIHIHVIDVKWKPVKSEQLRSEQWEWCRNEDRISLSSPYWRGSRQSVAPSSTVAFWQMFQMLKYINTGREVKAVTPSQASMKMYVSMMNWKSNRGQTDHMEEVQCQWTVISAVWDWNLSHIRLKDKRCTASTTAISFLKGAPAPPVGSMVHFANFYQLDEFWFGHFHGNKINTLWLNEPIDHKYHSIAHFLCLPVEHQIC